VSDTHFGHDKMYRFTNDDGSLIRPWAKDAAEGDEIMIENWNAVVRPDDRVYHLGDVAIPRRAIATLGKLNGRIILIKGNHDIFKLKDYLPYVQDIRATHKLDRFLLSHIPIHQKSLARWTQGNIHGHMHSNIVMKRGLFKSKPDKRYINVSVEQTNQTPVNYEEIL